MKFSKYLIKYRDKNVEDFTLIFHTLFGFSSFLNNKEMWTCHLFAVSDSYVMCFVTFLVANNKKNWIPIYNNSTIFFVWRIKKKNLIVRGTDDEKTYRKLNLISNYLKL